MELDKIILENFKIFKGQHIFDLRNLNIFTGPNNVGKSTLIKAISLFAKGIEEGDFPSIDLFETQAGQFKDLVNWESEAESFKIGFYIPIGEKEIPFKVMYEFVDGNCTKYTKEAGKAVFSNFEIFDKHGDFFFGAYSSETFEVTRENINYEIDWGNPHAVPTIPFKCALEDSSPPILFLKFNIKNLEKNLHLFTKNNYYKLFKHVKTLHKYNNWWIGRFSEEDFFTYGLSELTIEDVLKDFLKNEFLELLDYESSKEIFWGESEEIQEEIQERYSRVLEETDYETFIKKDVVFPLFNSISKILNLFKNRNFIHITYQNFNQRLFAKSVENKYLIDLFQSRDHEYMYGFTRKALEIFGFDAYIEMKAHLNRAIELNLVKGLNMIDEKSNNKF